jgi:AcrR family transcriptional regulator
VARDGIGRLTVEGVAREAAVARATVYRTFPGGRDELVEAVVLWAVGEFFTGLAQDIGPVDGVATLLERGLVAGRRRLAEHEVLQHALQVEADAVMPALAPVMPVVLERRSHPGHDPALHVG